MTGTGPADVAWDVDDTLAVTPVSRTWRVRLPGRLAVLRQDEPGAALLGLNREAEPEVLRAAAAAGLGPALISADPARGLLLTAWLPGRAWSAADLREPGNLRRAAVLLRRLHATPLAGPVVDLGAAIERYAAPAGAPGLAVRARADLARCRWLAGASGPGPARCFCHHDPTPGNFIAGPGGALHLIDWEYAGLGHPDFDLAGLAVGADFGPEEVRQLLAAYREGTPTGADVERHRAWEAFCRSLGALWAAALARETRSRG